MEINLRYGFNKFNKKNLTTTTKEKIPAQSRIVRLVEQGHITPVKALQMLKDKDGQLQGQKRQEHGSDKEENIESIIKELDELVGLKKIKNLVKELQAFITIQRYRAREQLQTEPLVLHMIFKGNPGTGKTTVARIIGKLFKELGVLPKGHLIEVERADLVGEYIGHTAQRTRDQVKKALGGILFIDEAYSLARGGEKDFGKEAIDVLVKAMEDHKDEFILILAGYKDEMDWFLLTNPGLRSRFPIHMEFPDYTVKELMDIAALMLKKRQYKLSEDAAAELGRIISSKVLYGHQHGGNARLVRNIIEKAIRRQAVRLVRKNHVSREELLTLCFEDLLEATEDGS